MLGVLPVGNHPQLLMSTSRQPNRGGRCLVVTGAVAIDGIPESAISVCEPDRLLRIES